MVPNVPWRRTGAAEGTRKPGVAAIQKWTLPKIASSVLYCEWFCKDRYRKDLPRFPVVDLGRLGVVRRSPNDQRTLLAGYAGLVAVQRQVT